MSKVILSGAAGFVGRTLLPPLLETTEDEIHLIDKMVKNSIISSYYDPHLNRVFWHHSEVIPRLKDLKDADTLICLAGATSVDAALKNPREAIEDNIGIAIDLAEWARCENPDAKIIYISSDEVLGESHFPLDESAPQRPTQPYAVSKAAAEQILHNYRDVYNLNIQTLRSCNLVGVNQQIPKLIPTAVQAIINGEHIPIHGDGKQEREWMSVEDFCQAILFLLRNDFPAQVYQATTNHKLSVIEVVQIICTKLNYEMIIEYVQDRMVQDQCYSMSARRLNSLGWYPNINPAEAIELSAVQLANCLRVETRAE